MDWVIGVLVGEILGVASYWLGFRDGRKRELLKNPEITITMGLNRVKEFNAKVDSEADQMDFLSAAFPSFRHNIKLDREALKRADEEAKHGSAD